MRSRRAPRPRTLVWEVTARCDLACGHCYNVWTAQGAARPADLDFAAMRTVIDRVADGAPGLRDLTLTGGEPLLRPDLVGRIGEIRTRLPRTRIGVATNGGRVTPGVARDLARAGASVLQLTLLAAQPEVHDRMAGRPGAFDRTLRAIAGAKAAGLDVAVFFVATAQNIDEFPGTAALAVSLGADALVFNRFQPGGRGLDGWPGRMPTPEQLAVARRQILDVRRMVDVSLGTIVPPCEDPGWSADGETLACPIGTRAAYPTIGPDGSLRPCNHSPAVAGSLLTSPLPELLKAGCMTRAGRIRRPAECEGCDDWRGCRGGCPAAREVAGGCVYRTVGTAPAQ